ncbi:MAG: AAA family ATPase [Phycisphaerales bacterium]|nr:AAA family ATPase [Phycisphaerales bacterium]
MSNFIQDIEISNFKSIRHQKIEGCKRINVFIGYPNVGKSNILEALSILSYIKGNETRIEEIIRVRDLSELFFDGKTEEKIIIKAFENRVVSIDLANEKNIHFTYSEINEEEPYVNKVTGSWSLKLDNNNEIVFETRNANKLNSENKILKKYSYKSEKEKNKSGNSSLLFPFGENLFHIIERNSELRKEVIDLLAFYGLKLLFDKGHNYTMKAMKTLSDETVFSIPFYQIADTLQRLIFYKAAIQTNSNSVLIFEEPEAHMFPPYIRKFTSDVVFDKTNQFFIATHSPYVLDEFIEEAPEDVAIYLVDYKNGETIIKNLSKENLEEIREFGVDLFFNLESYLKNG